MRQTFFRCAHFPLRSFSCLPYDMMCIHHSAREQERNEKNESFLLWHRGNSTRVFFLCIYIYIYSYITVCVCMCVCFYVKHPVTLLYTPVSFCVWKCVCRVELYMLFGYPPYIRSDFIQFNPKENNNNQNNINSSVAQRHFSTHISRSQYVCQ